MTLANHPSLTIGQPSVANGKFRQQVINAGAGKLKMGWTLLGSFALATFFVWLILAKNTLAEPLVFCSILTGSMLALMLECISFLGALTLTNVRVALIGSIIFCSALTFYFRRQVALSDEISTGEHSTTSVPLNSFSCAGASQRD